MAKRSTHGGQPNQHTRIEYEIYFVNGVPDNDLAGTIELYKSERMLEYVDHHTYAENDGHNTLVVIYKRK